MASPHEPVPRPHPETLMNSEHVHRSTVPELDVRLDNWLRRYGSPAADRVDAGTVAELLDVLEGRYPGLRLKIRDESGSLRPYVRVFVDGEDVSGAEGARTALAGARTIDILHSIAGG